MDVDGETVSGKQHWKSMCESVPRGINSGDK